MRKLSNQELGRVSAQEAQAQAKMPVVVVLDNIRSLNNVGSMFRTCDAFGARRLVLCGITGTPPDREIHKTALGAELAVEWEYSRKTEDALEKLRAEGYETIAVEQVEGAKMLNEFTPDLTKKYALVLGNEVDGVGEVALELCDRAVEIPQVGTKHSLNVAVSGGVVLWKFFELF